MGDEKTRKAEELLIESKNFFEFYKKQIGESVRRGNSVIELDFQELAKFSSKLSDEVLTYPEETLRIMEIGIEESGLITNPRVRLFNLPKIDLMKIRNIRSKNINELIAVEGIVRQASDVRPQVINAKFECPSCLPKGTLIQTPNGLEKIENVKEVYSIDKDFNLIIKKVNVIKTGLKKVVKLNNEISSSLEHKWFVYRNGVTKVIQTKNLKKGDVLYKIYGKYLCNLQEEYSGRIDKERKENLQLGMQKDTCKSSSKEWRKNKIEQSENNRIISKREIYNTDRRNINGFSQIDKKKIDKNEHTLENSKRTMQNKCKDFIYIQAWKKMWRKRISKINKRELSNKVYNMRERERFKKEIKCSSQRWQSLQQSNREFDYNLQFVPYEITQIDKTTKEIEMYDLQVSDTNNFILSNGIITHNCGTIISVLQMEKKFREPNRCSCGRRGGFKLISKEMVDTQRVVIEESPESLSGGEQPKRLNIFLKEDLVEPKMEEKTTPGSRILAIGILKEVPVPLHSGGLSTRFEIAIEANNLIPLEETFEELKITEEDEKQILELSSDPKIFEKLARSISPSIFGYDEIKKSMVLQLFGGVKKKHVDGSKSRGDIHILLVGDPGVAKSVMLTFMAGISPKGRYVVGKSASGAGLTATVVRDEYLRGWSLEAGAIVLANKGLVCIDELEKMDPNDRSAMHEAMEQQCMLPDFKLMLANGNYVKIGEFVDNLIEKNKEKVYKGKDCEILPVENVGLLSTDFNSHFKTNATKVSRHIAPKEFVKIELTNGREITATPEHPCWIVKDGKIITIPAKQLNKDMYFPIPSEIKIEPKKYEEKNDYLCKILGYHISDGCYELNRGKKTGIQFCNNDNLLIEDYKNAIENYFNLTPIITKRGNQKAVRVISKKVFEEMLNLDSSLLEKGDKKKIPEFTFNLPDENIKYLIRALYDGDGSVSFQKRNGCRISFVSQNRELEEQMSDLLLRFGISSSIFRDNYSKVWRLDISGGENLSKFLTDISFISQKKRQKLREYCELEKTYRTIRDIIPDCTDKINEIFKKLKISQRKTIGHSIDLGVEKQRIFLQKLVKIAVKKALQLESGEGDKIRNELKELEKLAFGYSRWIKIKNVSKIKNNEIKWVYDVTIEPYHTFISNGMILHNTVTISKANVQASLRAETSVLAAANPKFGRFDPYQSIPQQIDIPPTLINRFDVIFTLRDIPNKEKDELIATHVLYEHQKAGEGMIIQRDLFRKYIAYAKQKIFPVLSDEAVKELKDFYVTLRNSAVSSESAMRPIPISARQLTALIRMSEASAKIKLNSVVTKEDARTAIELIRYYLMQVGYDYESKTFDIDKITTGIATSQRNKIILVRETIARLEARLGKLIPIEEIEQELEGKLSEAEIEDAINKLNTTGDIFKPRRGYVQRP